LTRRDPCLGERGGSATEKIQVRGRKATGLKPQVLEGGREELVRKEKKEKKREGDERTLNNGEHPTC